MELTLIEIPDRLLDICLSVSTAKSVVKGQKGCEVKW